MLKNRDHKEEALQRYDHAIKLQSENADVFYNRAKTLEELNRFEE